MSNIIAWHTREPLAVAQSLQSDLQNGLTQSSAMRLLGKSGYNELPKQQGFSMLSAIFKQLTNPLAFVLVFAALATIFLHEFLDAFVIVIALLINIGLGVWQEGKAAHIFESLEDAQEGSAVVVRDGKKETINTNKLVVGDLVAIESGFSVPADIRLVEASGIVVNESSLTGEWASVEKNEQTLSTHNAPITERANMLWMSTIVVAGSGLGIVIATGAHAQIGKIAKSTIKPRGHLTPLQKSIRNIARTLMGVIVLTIVSIILLGVSRGESMADMLLIAIAVGVAAMPEGLPAAVTVALALAMEKILKKGGLVKNLVAAETLGSTTVILTDKTGTLTEGKMRLSGLYTITKLDVDSLNIEGDNEKLLKMAVLASDAFVEVAGDKTEVHGRPIEKAIVEGGLKEGIFQNKLFASGYTRLDFARFDPARRYAVSLNKTPTANNKVYISGSPEHILSHSGYYLENGEKRELTNEVISKFKDLQDKLSSHGKRFTAIAFANTLNTEQISETVLNPNGPKDFVFAGLLSFEDSVRDDVPAAIADAKRAGVRVIMATGDHKETARAVAIRTGIVTQDNDQVCTGVDMANMSDEELSLALASKSIFARVLPKQKLRIVRLLRKQGEIVAMTGDGINDAPALTAADIGLAVGSGTDVAKNAADLVLLKDSFSIITAAIAEGRRVVDNIRKIVAYLLSTSFGEIMLIGGSLIFSAPLPILPTQILWANIVGEGLMSFPFAFEPREKGMLSRKPSDVNATKILTKNMRRFLFEVTLTSGLLLLGLYAYLLHNGAPIDRIRTIMFLAVSVYSVFAGIAFKNLSKPFWETRIFANKHLLGGMLGSIAVLLLTFNVPALSTILSLSPITFADITLVMLIGVANLAIIEASKKLAFNTHPNNSV